MRNIQTHLVDQWELGQYEVYLFESLTDGRVFYGPDGDRHVWQASAPSVNEKPPPSIVIPYDAAHAVLGALSKQLGAVEHPQQLRADFEYERARVDRLLDALVPAGPRVLEVPR